jgi:hypothetical protein
MVFHGRDGLVAGASMVGSGPAGRRGARGGELVDGAPVSVAVVGSRIEAELIVGLLSSYGVSAAVATDDAGGQEPQLQLQGVRVLVGLADEAVARRLLAASGDSAGPMEG